VGNTAVMKEHGAEARRVHTEQRSTAEKVLSIGRAQLRKRTGVLDKKIQRGKKDEETS
jgi:hypothetical protein